jgi:hypothetical protein
MLAAGRDCATAGAGLAAAALVFDPAVLLCRTGVLEAHPISGTDRKLAAVRPKPCCINSLRDAIAHP